MVNSNQYALITGASSGIGYELAKLFAADNYNLVLLARDAEELEQKAKEFRAMDVDVKVLSKDLFNREDTLSVFQEIKDMGITIDVLVNDAGQGLYGQFKDTELDRELDIIELNISAVVILTKAFLKDMLTRNEGKILNLASIASKAPGPWQSVYHGTKAFILSFTEAIREELKDTNITVTALLPGATATDFFNKAEMNESKIVQDQKLADPAKVAKDGFDALFADKDKVISGMKNKIMVGMTNMVSDSAAAHAMSEQQKPKEEDGH
ncbi:SDR family NAD(P)-dependent oxidoreductase [Pedobacter sp.]|uniref:SDR family NAD(P)-dependent oxidoreductase n=1 Tax=Pedobacter sp. TaxID=1411316 RepID=UPI003D7F868E